MRAMLITIGGTSGTLPERMDDRYLSGKIPCGGPGTGYLPGKPAAGRMQSSVYPQPVVLRGFSLTR